MGRQETPDFAGQVALVTGGSRGIGKACAVLLASRGARVALNYVANDAAAEQARDEIEAGGGECRLYKADAGDPIRFKQAVAAVRSEMGPVSLLVANAGVTKPRDHTELTYEIWRETLRSNLDSAFLAISAVKDEMLTQGFGRIVCLSSIGALRPRPRQIDYCAAKAGVIGMLRCFAEALAPAVRVNGVAPGLIETDMLGQLDQQILPGRIEATPLKRLGAPSEIAEAVAFLLSERASFITGECIVVSGGAVMSP